MLKIKENYDAVSVEYRLGAVTVTKKLAEITISDIDTAKKYGVNLMKYFEEKVENTDEPTQLPTIAYEGVEVTKPKRKKK